MSKHATGRKQTLSDKKAAVLGTAPRRRTPLIAGVAVLVLLAVGAAIYLPGSRDPLPAAPGVAAAGDAVASPGAALDDGKAHYYEHRHADLTIRYFVVKSA